MRGPRAHGEPRFLHVDETAAEDFAFADTVVASELDEVIPPSGLVIDNEAGQAHCVTLAPLRYDAAPADPYTDHGAPRIGSSVRGAWARLREEVEASRAEMTELWSATACVERSEESAGDAGYDDAPLARAATVGRRVRTLFSFFEWDRADLLRAAWLGLVVFVLAATAGAFALERGPTDSTRAIQTSGQYPR